MRSSLAAYDEALFDYEDIRADSWMMAVQSGMSNITANNPNPSVADITTPGPDNYTPQSLGPTFGGAFTIPVCYYVGNKAPKTVVPNRNRSPPPVHDRPKQWYPCWCGPVGGPNGQGSETDGFRNATGLANFDAYNKWCNGGQNEDGGLYHAMGV